MLDYTRGSQFHSPPPPRSAYFACLSLLTHLIQIISLLEVRTDECDIIYLCKYKQF